MLQFFDQLDKDKNGLISRIELIKAMRNDYARLGPVLGLLPQRITQEGESRQRFEEVFSVIWPPYSLWRQQLVLSGDGPGWGAWHIEG